MNHQKSTGTAGAWTFYEFSYRQDLGFLSFVSSAHPGICRLTTAKLCRLVNLRDNDSSI
jgi:hypothetical protein